MTLQRFHLAALLLALAPACGLFSSGTTRGTARTEPAGLRWRSLHRDADAGAPASDGAVATNDAAVPRCPPQSVLVQGGSFVMGLPEGEGAPDEHPSHQVTLHTYCIDRLEVAVDAYNGCVTARACTRAGGNAPRGDAPVTGIDWGQAEAYCRYVGGRLPSEAEWEFAARGADGRRFPWGNEPPTDCARLDWTPAGQTLSCGGVGPSAVGGFTSGASPYGALDMAGNVWEWVADWYAPAYATGVARNPTGPAEGTARVTRGGGWNNDQIERLRATWREGQHPAFHDYDLGVRCAYDVAE